MRKKVVWLIYDADTAIGINNEGALVFSYNLEDIDHLGSGANVFNGQDSVMWVNLRQAFFDEIKEMYKTLRSTGALSYARVEGMFEEHQGKWPEAIFNADSWFKYLAPLVEKGNATYLSMLQGSKGSQRKWWLYNRFKYLDSKYNAGDSLNDFIELRGYAKGDITVTPYADIYASVKYGSYLVQTRAGRTVACTLACPLDELNDTEIAIYSCSQLSSVGDLSALKVGRANFSNAVRLQEIKLGDSDSEYSNGNLTELTLGNNSLLRKLDVRNCPNLVQAVDISHCVGLEEAYFDGTGIVGLGLPNGGVLKELHLPASVANLTIRNQAKITEFVMPSYANITTLRLENVSSAVPVLTILYALQANARVRVVGFSMDAASVSDISDFYDILDTFRGLDENGGNVDQAQVAGTIRVPSATGAQVAALKARYPYIDVRAEHITAVLTYHNHDGSQVLGTETVSDYGDGTRVNDVARASTAQYDFTPNGWAARPGGDPDANAVVGIGMDKDVYAAYTKTTRTYTVTFVRDVADGGGTLYTQTEVPYGTVPTYGGSTPASTQGTAEEYPFEGWMPELAPVDGTNLTYTAVFRSHEPELWGDLFAAIDNGTVAGDYAIGDTLPITLTGVGRFTAEIVGLGADRDENAQPIPVTFMLKELLPDTAKMNDSATNSGGWTNSAMRMVTMPALKAKLPDFVAERIIPAKKYSYYNYGGVVTIDECWIPNAYELGDTSFNAEASGARYAETFTSQNSRIKKRGGVASTYWIRSAMWGEATSFLYFLGSGLQSNGRADQAQGIALGFCVGGNGGESA